MAGSNATFAGFRDSLAAPGVRLARAYARSPVCGPSYAAAYLGLVSHLDARIGRLLEGLAALGCGPGPDTIFAFSLDHGHLIGEHGLAGKGVWQYEGVSRIPVIFSRPGHLPENRVHHGLFDGLDFLPTLLFSLLQPLQVPSGQPDA